MLYGSIICLIICRRIMVVSKKDVFSGMKVSWTHDWSELNGPPTLDSVSGGNTLLISMKVIRHYSQQCSVMCTMLCLYKLKDISKSNKFICFHNQRYAKVNYKMFSSSSSTFFINILFNGSSIIS